MFGSFVACSVSLSRSLIASLLANGLLCAFPVGSKGGRHTFDFFCFYEGFNNSDASRRKTQAAKFRCILHYFEHVQEHGLASLPGHVTFKRLVLDPPPSLEDWLQNTKPLCRVEVLPKAAIENTGALTLQVDFANRYLGGGVLETGRVQEEIRFCINPELLVSILFMAPMESNEAVVIQGTERFSYYSGYSHTLKYTGDYQDKSQCDQSGAPLTTIVAIDALNMGRSQGGQDMNQYGLDLIYRELTKSYAGFYSSSPDLLPSVASYADSLSGEIIHSALSKLEARDSFTSQLASAPQSSLKEFADKLASKVISEAIDPTPTSLDEFASEVARNVLKSVFQCQSWADELISEVTSSAVHVTARSENDKCSYRAVATGNWGCGAFGGDPQLKSMIQWISVSAAGRPAMLYHPYGDKRVAELQKIVGKICAARWNIKRLMTALSKYRGKHARQISLFDFLLSKL
eukprot:m.90909 g.90909  ORF g.90909 m.90909 type:complete len:461 (+) comp36668_c0_seq6:825-2207(+)